MKRFVVIEVGDQGPMKAWGQELMSTRHKEAVESLIPEGVDREIVAAFVLEGKKYLAWFMDASGEINPPDMNMQVNKDHAEVKRAAEFKNRTEGEILYDLGQESEP
jgi:hypothetical protein